MMFRSSTSAILFLSTPSARRATSEKLPANCQQVISIHALREEGDERLLDALELAVEFLSTPSARRATPQTPGRPPCQ